MSREYKNVLKLRDNAIGNARRKNLAKEIVGDSSPFPNPLEYKDIDEEFRRWVDEDLEIDFEGEKLPTITLYSNQRFSEYMQSWENVDDKRNLILNFKTISRENNPKTGTINGQTKNIPGEHTILMKRVEAYDRNNRKYFIDYRIKQPYSVDLIYTISLVTNKYELINNFNQMMNDKFKAINCYLRPKGHYIPMKLNDILDESEYSIDDRRYYSQSYNITVMAYIMPEDSFIVEEKPYLKLTEVMGDDEEAYTDIEESVPCIREGTNPYYYQPMTLTSTFGKCSFGTDFTMDCEFILDGMDNDNVRGFRLFINDEEQELSDENIENGKIVFHEGDHVKISKVVRLRSLEGSVIRLKGYDPSTVKKIK